MIHSTPIKIINNKHQYLGVNNDIQTAKDIEHNNGRLGDYRCRVAAIVSIWFSLPRRSVERYLETGYL